MRTSVNICELCTRATRKHRRTFTNILLEHFVTYEYYLPQFSNVRGCSPELFSNVPECSNVRPVEWGERDLLVSANPSVQKCCSMLIYHDGAEHGKMFKMFTNVHPDPALV